jgi:hypothetical protein
VKEGKDEFNERRERQKTNGGDTTVPFQVVALYIVIFFVAIVKQIGHIVDSLSVV